MNKFKQLGQSVFFGTALSFASMTASAAVIDINIDNVASWAEFGDTDNTILLFDVGSGSSVTIDGIGWDLSIATQGDSWLSEAVISFGSTADAGLVDIAPGIDDLFEGSGTYSSGGILDLTDAGLDDMVLADGILRLQFFEDFDDIFDSADATYEGFLSVSIVEPLSVSAPGMLALFSIGLLGVGFIRRNI